MEALFIGQAYIDVTFLTDRMPTGDEKHVASAYTISFGGVFLCGTEVTPPMSANAIA